MTRRLSGYGVSGGRRDLVLSGRFGVIYDSSETRRVSLTVDDPKICDWSAKRSRVRRGTERRVILRGLYLWPLMNMGILLSLFAGGFQSDRRGKRGCFLNRDLWAKRGGRRGVA